MPTHESARADRVTEARRLRAEEGWSKRQIAAHLGVSTGTLTDWLRGVEPPTWTKRPNAKDDQRDRARQPVSAFMPTTVKRHNPKTVRHNTGEGYRGCLVIYVLESRELYWRIEGMVSATVRSAATAATRAVKLDVDQSGESV